MSYPRNDDIIHRVILLKFVVKFKFSMGSYNCNYNYLTIHSTKYMAIRENNEISSKSGRATKHKL